MARAIWARVDPFIVMMLALVALASVFPARGMAAEYVALAADVSICALFFLHGAKLSREAIRSGFAKLRLHGAVLVTTFIVFPVLGIAAHALLEGMIDRGLRDGILFVCLLPSTVQSSIAFVSIAKGDVPAAICSAAFSSLLGIFLTPVLVALTLGGLVEISPAAVQRIALQLLLPFVLGHALRPLLAGWVERHRALVGKVDRSSILLVVFSAFSASVVNGLWQTIDLADLGALLALSGLLLAVVLCLTWWGGAVLGFERQERVVLLFCGSKKSLATGVPIASTLFPASVLGAVILPLMVFHQLQLIVCAFIAQSLARPAERTEAEA